MKEMHARQSTHVIVMIVLAQADRAFALDVGHLSIVFVCQCLTVNMLLISADISRISRANQLLFHTEQFFDDVFVLMEKDGIAQRTEEKRRWRPWIRVDRGRTEMYM